jgi:hypothetical protein
MMSHRSLWMIIAAVLAALLTPAAALADGDPASDVLPVVNVFYPYSPSVARNVQQELDAETAAAKRAHFPIKVALIASPTDLGAIQTLYGQPQQYARFLESEISFESRQLLLVVMAAGYGVQGLPPAAARLAASLPKPSGGQVNSLARAAVAAVPKLAAVTGHPLTGALRAPTTTTSNGPTAAVLALPAIGAVAIAGAILVLRNRTSHRIDRRNAVGGKRER